MNPNQGTPMRHLYRVTSAAWGGTPRFVVAESATEAEEATRAPMPSYTRLAELPGDAEEIGAELAEARTELANERGEGEPPAERWAWDATYKQWILWGEDGKFEALVSRGAMTRWAWELCGDRDGHGYAPTARAAMRAATKAAGGAS